MRELIDYQDDKVFELRMLILACALGQKSLTYFASQGKAASVNIFPFGGKYPCYILSTFPEGAETDGAIAHVSFEDYDISEGALTLFNNGTVTYLELDVDSQVVHKGDIQPRIAAALFQKFEGIFE